LHVNDAVTALMTSPASVGEIINIGGTEEISIQDLAERVREATGGSSNIVFVPYAEAYEEGFEDMLRRVPDVSKLRAITGFRPQMTLDAVLRDVIRFERERLCAGAASAPTLSARE
jgi:UDP-glucose 4-epimerase